MYGLLRWVAVYVLVLLAGAVYAQHPKDDIKQNIRRSANSLMAYPGPQKQQLTPAPQGKQPFYISHYGRHGSHHLLHQESFDAPYQVLDVADKAGKLTDKGRDVKRRIEKIRDDAYEQLGELTPIGVWQQQIIAQRMVERFPEVFLDGTDVDARSATITRCMLSMEQFLLQLTRMKPRLNVYHNATNRDMAFLNQQNRQFMKIRMDSMTQRYNQFSKRYDKFNRLMRTLFNDMTYVKQHVDAKKLNDDLFMLASNMQNTELRKNITFYDIFTDQDLYYNWIKENAWWYINYGGSPLNGGIQPYSQRNLLRKIINDADSCLKLKNPCVQLRFGHDNVILPLACLMDVNHWGLATNGLGSLGENGWSCYRIVPMSANIQLIFYRSNPDDQDVWVKVLYNEDEATLPLPNEHAPYYRWTDFRSYYLKKLDDYEKH
jgi:hypothetical protein